jgi:hypothetical protein
MMVRAGAGAGFVKRIGKVRFQPINCRNVARGRLTGRVRRRLRRLRNDGSAIWRVLVVALRWALRRRNKPPVRHDVVISLTSYAGRFATLHWTLKCLLTQSVAAPVVLWVGHEDRAKIPPAVEALRTEGLDIRTTEDIRSYTKIIPALLAFPRMAIVTADDDVFYPRHWLKRLLTSWGGDREVVVVHRAHEMKILADGNLGPYHTWRPEVAAAHEPALLFPTGVAGALYPPGVLHEVATRSDLFLKLCPSADDIWLYWMARLRGARVRLSGFRFRLVNWPGSQAQALSDSNIGLSQNDVQITNMLRQWPISFEVRGVSQ